MTPYGRQISSTLMSSGSAGKEAEFLHFLPLPSWLRVGGDVRGVGIYRDTPQVRNGRYLLMQADLEVAGVYGPWTADVSAGAYNGVAQSRKHYVNYRPTDELSFRAGRFQQAFGLMAPDHRSSIQRHLGWDEGSESYNVEAAWLGEQFSTFLTGNFGRPDDAALDAEKGISVRPAMAFWDRFQVGLSYYAGTKTGLNRQIGGPFAVLGFTPRLALMSEWVLQKTSSVDTRSQNGFSTLNQLNYEPLKGLVFYVEQESARRDFLDSRTQFSAYGLGTQFFPRPHFEFNLLWQRQKLPAFPLDWSEYVTVQSHYYF
ncbi:hypothetical protein WDW86_19445 [Bdellovibrionota bacterium FG-2]